MIRRDVVAILITKELRQLRRNRGAILSSTIFPFLFLLVVPLLAILAVKGYSAAGAPPPPVVPDLPGTASAAAAGTPVRDPLLLLRTFTLPLEVVAGCLLLPAVTAAHAIVAERERRTIELLVALPLATAEVLTAKILVVLAVSAAIALPLVLVDTLALVGLGVGSLWDALALLALVVAALTFSTAGSVTLALLSRDFRTATNLNGLLLIPAVLVCLLVLTVGPHRTGTTFGLAALLGLLGVAITLVARSTLDLDRLVE